MANDYILERPDIFDIFENGGKLSNGRYLDAEEYTKKIITYNSIKSANKFGCNLLVSEDRIEEARQYFLRDVKRFDFEDPNTDPCEFKRTAALVYWLRRRGFVSSCDDSIGYDTDAGKERQNNFKEFPTEFCSFMIGYRICYWLANAETINKDVDLEHKIPNSLQYGFLYDSARLLRMSNVSPHGLYLIYRSLFL